MIKYWIAIVFLLPIHSWASVAPEVLSHAVQERIIRVPEFKFIAEEVKKMNIDAYLFGGSASAFGHYIRWDLERESGDVKYHPERFDYDFTNIYRGNQDLDLVIDGTKKQAAMLERILMSKYPHLIGNKNAWEIRLLRYQVKDKLPLLNNSDFLNQHTDTNSTGLLKLTAKKGEIVFRDLFEWGNPNSKFLSDVSAGRIKFLFSSKHETTSRFKEGKNPPVFAAIRYLAKLAQYEVESFDGDFEIIKKIVEEANWDQISQNEYLFYKLKEFGLKVLLNAPDSEYAWNLLEDSGLRARLISMDGSKLDEPYSLSWWMNKEPLRSKELGSLGGRLASDIFKDDLDKNGDIIVAHDTMSFEVYENITRSSKGRVNAFISRDGVSGESASDGNGFYTKLGTKGAWSTNLSILFKLNPKAREGSDFFKVGHVIIVTNKNALTLVQENLNISFQNFLKLLAKQNKNIENKGVFEKFARKYKREFTANPENYYSLLNYIKTFDIESIKSTQVLKMWYRVTYPHYFDIPESIFPELDQEDITNIFLNYILPNILDPNEFLAFISEDKISRLYLLDHLVNNENALDRFIENLLDDPGFNLKDPGSLELVSKLLEVGFKLNSYRILNNFEGLIGEVNASNFEQFSQIVFDALENEKELHYVVARLIGSSYYLLNEKPDFVLKVFFSSLPSIKKLESPSWYSGTSFSDILLYRGRADWFGEGQIPKVWTILNEYLGHNLGSENFKIGIMLARKIALKHLNEEDFFNWYESYNQSPSLMCSGFLNL